MVSRTDQNESRQRVALEQQAIPSNHIFMDKLSGKDFQRPQYQAMLKKLRPGDLLCITSIDRLGRNYEEILELSYHCPGNPNSLCRIMDACP